MSRHWILFLTLLAVGGLVSMVIVFACTSSSSTTIHSSFRIFQEPMNFHSGLHKDVIYYCPRVPPKTFQRMIASSQGKIIASSNSYLIDSLFCNDKSYEAKYGMYGGLWEAYQHLSQPVEEHITTPIVMVSNSFTGTNSGHDLGTLLGTLLYIQKHKLEHVTLGIQEYAFRFPRILEILHLFQTNYIVFQFERVYKVDEMHLLSISPRFVIEQYKQPSVIQLINDIQLKSQFYLSDQGCNPPKNSKIILIKQIANTSARCHDAFDGATFLDQMSRRGWIVLNPEFDDMRYMIVLLSQASHIIVSFGSIMWTHMLFFNPLAHVLHLEVAKEHAYEPVARMKHFQKRVVTNVHLDDAENEGLRKELFAI